MAATGFKRLGNAASGLGGSFVDSFKALGSSITGIGERAGNAGTSFASRAAGAGGWVLERAEGAYSRFPKLAALATLGAVGLGVKNWMDARAEAQQREVQARNMISYMNTVNPAEAALMESRMRGSAPGQGGRAEAELQRRDAAAAQISG